METMTDEIESDALIECMLDALDDIFYVLDTEGDIVRVNETAVDVTGYSRDTLTSMNALEVVAPDDRDAVEDDVQTALDTGHAQVEASLLTKDDEKIPYEFRKQRLTNSNGDVIGMVGIGRDISERKRRERQLRRQATQFESFGSTLSHDLRTPLNTLEGRLELARETGESEHFDAAERALDRLDTLIEDLATVMREGQLTNEITDVDLDAVARSCWETLDTSNASVVVEETRPIRADESALTRLLENLLRNAVEHGGEDVTVRIGMLPNGFYVEDDGVGISEDEREDVFEPGFTTKEDGTGFGMVSVQQTALAHGWSVTVTESSDGGARFEFTDVEVPR